MTITAFQVRCVIATCFDWRADVVGDVVRVTARGATAGFGETVEIASTNAVRATFRDFEDEALAKHHRVSPAVRLTDEQLLDEVRRAAIFAVHRHA